MQLLKKSFPISLPSALLISLVMSTQLTACFPIVAGTAVTGGAMAADRRSSGIYIEDNEIELKAENKINKELGDYVHVNVVSFNRSVLITGEAFNAENKAKAEAIVRGIPNVKNITNEMVIAPKSSLGGRSNDAYLTSKVKARMIPDHQELVSYVKVFTEASVVYLMGIVSHKEADIAVDIARSTEGVDKVVKVFEYTD
jgi:osmotically-inducible protein OsmY